MSRFLDVADQVLARVGDRAEAQVLVTGGTSSLTRFANSFIHQNVAEESTTVALKLAREGRIASAQTSRLDGSALDDLVERTLEAARHRPVDAGWPGQAPPAPAGAVEHYDPATEAATPDQRAAAVRAFVDAGEGLLAAGYCETTGGVTAFANSAGQRLDGRSSRATLDGIHQMPGSAGKGHATAVGFGELDPVAVGSRAAGKARAGADPVDLEPGRYEVILEPECVATILTFLGFYGMNAKQHIEGQSYVRLGEAQFDPAIAIWDDATQPGAVGLGFDTDGTPKRRVDLVVNGISSSLVHDRRTAARMDTDSTGHAIPGGDVWGAFPFNVFLGTGEATVDEMVATVERGLLVTEFNYCRILDPKTQVTTGLTRNGTFLIEGGEVVSPVGNLRFTQSFVEALGPGAVKAVGRAARFADAEFGVGIINTPALHLASWNFTGGARG